MTACAECAVRRVLLVALLGVTACASGAGRTGIAIPIDQNTRDQIQGEALDQLLTHPELMRLDEQITAICVGTGLAGAQAPSVQVLRPFADYRPTVVAAPACRREGDEGGLPTLIEGPGGQQALLLAFGELTGSDNRGTLQVRVARTGGARLTVYCTVDRRTIQLARMPGEDTPVNRNRIGGWEVSGCA